MLQKNAAARGVSDLKVNYLTFAGGAVMNDALLSGTTQFAAEARCRSVVLWAKNAQYRASGKSGGGHEFDAAAPQHQQTRKLKLIRDLTGCRQDRASRP